MQDWQELVPISDVFADGIAEIQNLGTNYRTIYFSWQRSPGGLYEKVAVMKIVRPMTSIVDKDSHFARGVTAAPRVVPQGAH
jgi:hypothetical protein